MIVPQVCKLCFDSEQQGTGATRSMMKEFRQLRSAFRNLDPKIHRYKLVESSLMTHFYISFYVLYAKCEI